MCRALGDGEFYGFGLMDGLGGQTGDEGEGLGLPPWPREPLRCRRCPQLSAEGAYDVWIVAEDDGNNARINASAGRGTGGTDLHSFPIQLNFTVRS
jgi:hypothetical protein